MNFMHRSLMCQPEPSLCVIVCSHRDVFSALEFPVCLDTGVCFLLFIRASVQREFNTHTIRWTCKFTKRCPTTSSSDHGGPHGKSAAEYFWGCSGGSFHSL